MTDDAQFGVIRLDFSRPPRVKIMFWGLGIVFTRIAERKEMTYANQEALPEWLKRKLAVLMSIDPDGINESIPLVGRRVSRHVYWVYPGYGETLGADPGEKSKERRPKNA